MEEYTVLTKKIIRYVIVTAIVVHVLLLLMENLPVVYVLVGLAAHTCYLSLLSTFPFIEFTDPRFIASLGTPSLSLSLSVCVCVCVCVSVRILFCS